ncbi:MAG: hypothetical protein ACOWW1_10825 [archaeon]
MSKPLFCASVVLVVLFSFLFVGSVGASSEVIWSQTYGTLVNDSANAIIQTSDRGYALAGYTRSPGAGSFDFWLVKTDAYGNMEWNQTYRGASNEEAYGLIETSDGGYVLAGCGLLVKTDKFGNMEWNQTIGGSIRAVVESSGGYTLAGWTTSFGAGEGDFWLIKTDARGNVDWNQTYGGAEYDRAFSLIVTSDGGYALAGQTLSFGSRETNHWDFLLIKTDADGNMEWYQTYGSTRDERANVVVETSDGGYSLAGYTAFLNPEIGIVSDFWLVKTDASGNMEWNQTYSGGEAYGMVETLDGGFALAGGARLVKTDKFGCMEWNQTYEEGLAYSLVACLDGGYALAGMHYNSTASPDDLDQDFWLAKTDEHGFIPEFPVWAVLPIFLATTFTVIVYKQKLTKNQIRN